MIHSDITNLLTPVAVLRLRRLGTYAYHEQLPAGFQFGMQAFTGDLCEDERRATHTECGTAGCLAGVAPYAGVTKRSSEGWLDFSRRLATRRPLWRLLFSGYWRSVDNTPDGGGLRILYVLTHGLALRYATPEPGSREMLRLAAEYASWTPPPELLLSRDDYERAVRELGEEP